MTDDASLSKRQADMAAALRELPEDVLVTAFPHPENWQGAYAGELQRRVLVTNRELIDALRDFNTTSDTASRRLLVATWVLIVLTVIIAAFAIVLVWSELAK
jgi:hypothetical protein